MNADDAFDKLMRENKLAIPVADAADFVRARRTAPAPDVMRVASVDDADDGYVPGGMVDEGNGLSAHPTETDLAPVLGEDAPRDAEVDLEGAEEEGAHIVGADSFAGDEFEPPPVPDRRIGGALLAGARRVRRFAQLPLAGAADFESAAMELAVGQAAADPERPSLLLVSAVHGEGRTEVALRLALALAKRVGSRILLADFDLKNPQVAVRLGLTLKYFALADVLNGTCPLEEALVVSDEDNLYVLPARRSDRAGDEVVDSKRAAALMAAIHASFEFAVIDSGPIGQSEAQVLCRHAGAVAVVGYRGLTTARQLERTAASAESAGARVAGMILAGM